MYFTALYTNKYKGYFNFKFGTYLSDTLYTVTQGPKIFSVFVFLLVKSSLQFAVKVKKAGLAVLFETEPSKDNNNCTNN